MRGVIRGPQVLKHQKYIHQNNLFAHSPNFWPSNFICYMVLFTYYYLCSLQNDQRYLVLECVAEERNRMLMVYIDDLRIKGPPPPPTASNPSDRVRK